jgi:hypothetical protein
MVIVSALQHGSSAFIESSNRSASQFALPLLTNSLERRDGRRRLRRHRSKHAGPRSGPTRDWLKIKPPEARERRAAAIRAGLRSKIMKRSARGNRAPARRGT